jgi:ABC-type multidrug transport system fused ATPase/permease subunit
MQFSIHKYYVPLKKIIRDTFAILTGKEKGRLLLLAASDVMIALFDLAALGLLLLILNFYTQPGRALPHWLPGKPLQALLLLVLVFIGKNMAAFFLQRMKSRFVYSVATRLSESNLLQYLEGDYSDYVSKDSSVHIRRISQQPVEFAHYVLSGIQQLFSEGVMILLATAVLIAWHPAVFGLLCLVLLPPLLLLSFFIKAKLGRVRSNIRSSSEQSLQYLKEALAGYVESAIYHSKDFFVKRYRHRQQELNQYLANLQSAQALPFRFMEVFAVLGLLAFLAINEWHSGEAAIIPVFTLGAFVAAAYKIIPALVKLLNLSSQVKTYQFSLEGLKMPPATSQSNKLSPERITEIACSGLYFRFGEQGILNNFNLCLKQGEMTGLTGFSGRGKSTLNNLLLGFLEPAGGELLVNGRAADVAELHRFRGRMSYVKQQPFLVHDTIASNITLHEQAPDTQRLERALRISGLDRLLHQWPNGLQTVITEQGRNISGGQRQRIAFARALYKEADVLLLDEPFNELDEAAESAMLQHLQALATEGKIILMITHDAKSLSFCTNIISLDAGK